MEVSKSNKRVLEDVVLEQEENSMKRLKEDFLDDSDEETAEFVPEEMELRSFIKSFEDEITTAPPAVDLASECSESGESRTDLCFLLEATDDELGLPTTAECSPAVIDGGHEQMCNESEASGEFWEVPAYEDSFGYGFGFGFGLGFGEIDDGGTEYVALDGLFDHSDMGFVSGDSFTRCDVMPTRLEFSNIISD